MRNESRLASSAVVGGILACCALLLPVVAASAQQQGAGPGAPGVQNVENVWELQAKWVAQELALTPELTAKLVDAYKAARQSHVKAIQTQFGQQRGERPNMDTMKKINDSERATFEAALKGFLSPEQTTKALESLGGFNRRWDRLVAALDGLKLDDATKAKAMAMVAAYAAESDKAMRAAMDGGSVESVRENMMKMREKLDSDLAGVLSAEQMTQWKEASATRGRGRSGEGRRENPPTPAPAPEPAPAK